MALQSFNITSYLFSGDVPQRYPRAGHTPFWNVYRGSDDRCFAIGMLLNRGWPQICEVIDRPELEHDERFASYRSRVGDHAQELMAILDEVFAERPADEWVEALNERGVYCARVQDYEEIAKDPQVVANGYIVEVERSGAEPVRMVATPGRIRSLAPELGQHTEEVLLEAGYG